MSDDAKAEKRVPPARFVATAEVGEAFREAASLDRQRFRSDLDDLTDQDVTPRCFQAD